MSPWIGRCLVMFAAAVISKKMVRGIYERRCVKVRESTGAGVKSSIHWQCFGILSGCPLSFLFVILMIILIQDADMDTALEILTGWVCLDFKRSQAAT